MNRNKQKYSKWEKYHVVYLMNYYLKHFSSEKPSLSTKEPTEFMRKLDERLEIKEKSEDSIGMAFKNYHHLNPAYKKKGLYRVTKLTREVWGKFKSNPKKYKRYAQQIKKAVINNTELPNID